jgi:hypothetical protein
LYIWFLQCYNDLMAEASFKEANVRAFLNGGPTSERSQGSKAGENRFLAEPPRSLQDPFPQKPGGLLTVVAMLQEKKVRPELPFKPIDVGEGPVFQQVQKETLCQVLGVLRRMPASPGKGVEWIPIELIQFGKRRLTLSGLALCRNHDNRPPGRAKSRYAFRYRVIFQFHRKFPHLN